MAGNVSGNAYALTILSPIRHGHGDKEIAYADLVRDKLEGWNAEANSPMLLVPQTYLCRFFVLDDVYTESLPGADLRNMFADLLTIFSDKARRDAMPHQDRLMSRYLVFSCNFHCGASGTPDAYLRGMWQAIRPRIEEIWGHCYGFDRVHDADGFVDYMKKCQRTAALFFVGSTDDPLEEQLKSLYLKQEFTKFAIANQGLDTATLRANFQAFIQRTAPTDLARPSWRPGQYRL